jgi:hypothetical protein
MHYRVAYDVLDDGALVGRAHELAFLGFALAWTTVWCLVYRFNRGLSPEKRKQMRGGFVVGALFIAVGAWLVLTRTLPRYREQRQCQAWLRSGEVETVEGVIRDFDPATKSGGRHKPYTDFRVGDARFSYAGWEPKVGGFQGDFTDPAASDLRLRDGLPVRISHREGRILRIEVGER